MLKEVPGGIEIRLKVVPGASRDRIAGPLGDRLKIQVASPPEHGKANDAVLRLLAGKLKLSLRDIDVISGRTTPAKTVFARGVSIERARAALMI